MGPTPLPSIRLRVTHTATWAAVGSKAGASPTGRLNTGHTLADAHSWLVVSCGGAVELMAFGHAGERMRGRGRRQQGSWLWKSFQSQHHAGSQVPQRYELTSIPSTAPCSLSAACHLGRKRCALLHRSPVQGTPRLRREPRNGCHEKGYMVKGYVRAFCREFRASGCCDGRRNTRSGCYVATRSETHVMCGDW